MSTSNKEIIMGRIAVATPESPLAVFKCGSDRLLNCVPKSTVMTSVWLDRGFPELVGIFHRDMPTGKVSMMLKAALGGEK